jgi:hypothetical protein
MNQTPEKSTPPVEEDNSFIGMLQREWPQVKRLLFHVACFVAGITICAIGYEKLIIPGKDATIQAKDSVIQSKESEITAKEKAVQLAQQTVTAKDDLIVSLTNQFYQLAAFQKELSTVQTNIVEQQKKLEDVEVLVHNLFSKTVYETIGMGDTNRVFRRQLTNGTWQCFVLLKHAAIYRSLHGTVTGTGLDLLFPQAIKQPAAVSHNVMVQHFPSDWEFKGGEFVLQYVRNTTHTNLVQRVEFVGDGVLFDGVPVRFVASEDELISKTTK